MKLNETEKGFNTVITNYQHFCY